MPPAARPLAPSFRIGGKYVLSKRIATGGMGDVWVARNETTDALVALKILRPSTDERTQVRERFRREAKLGGLLVHRSICRIFDFLEEPDGTLVLVMELLRGETLEQFLTAKKALSAQEAVAVMVPVLSALQHGHEHAVIHRDIKPANIFLAVEPDGRVIPKLLDFGIAKVAASGTVTIDGLVLGTPSYMSPEQISSGEALDGRSDLFSAGVVLYEALTGTCPFAAPAPSAAIASVLMNEVDPDPRIDPRLWIELSRALKKRPAERHVSAAEMATALCAAIGETEDSVGVVLRRSKPPPMRDAISMADASAHETQSVEGQSVANAPRRAPAWAAWGAGAAAVAVTLGALGVTTLHGRAPAVTTVTSAPAAVTPTPVKPAESAGAGANAGGNESAGRSGGAMATGSTSASAGPGASGAIQPARASTPRPAKHAPPKPNPPARPKKIATEPGF